MFFLVKPRRISNTNWLSLENDITRKNVQPKYIKNVENGEEGEILLHKPNHSKNKYVYTYSIRNMIQHSSPSVDVSISTQFYSLGKHHKYCGGSRKHNQMLLVKENTDAI